MSISKNIKKLRAMYDLSQKDLALIAGVSDKAVSTWETGAKEPRMGAIQRIADHFGLKKSNIIEEDGLDTQVAEPTAPPPTTNTDTLSDDEHSLVTDYRALTPTNKTAARATITALRQTQEIIA